MRNNFVTFPIGDSALIAWFFADFLIQQRAFAEVCERFRALELTLPPMTKRDRIERFDNSVRQVLFPRDHSVVAQLTAELAG